MPVVDYFFAGKWDLITDPKMLDEGIKFIITDLDVGSMAFAPTQRHFSVILVRPPDTLPAMTRPLTPILLEASHEISRQIHSVFSIE